MSASLRQLAIPGRSRFAGPSSGGSRLGLRTFSEIFNVASSASSVDSQFPADPASRVPRPVARAATRNSPSIPTLRVGPRAGRLAPLPEVVEDELVEGDIVFHQLRHTVHEVNVRMAPM